MQRSLQAAILSKPAFSPLLVGGLKAWHDASVASSIVSTAGAVSQWNDLSGNGNHAPQSNATNKPTTGIRTINNRNALDFDGTNGRLLFPSSMYSIPNGDNTVFAVTLLDVTGVSQNACGMVTSGTARWRLLPCDTLNTNVSGSDNTDNVSGIATVAATLSTAVPTITTLLRSGSSAKVASGGVFGSAATAASFTATDGCIGALRSDGTQSLNGGYGELIIFGAALSNPDLNRIGNYLSKKWGAPWTNV